MILVAKESNYNPARVIQEAVKFFGPDGVGLEVQQQDAASAQLVGGGGYVRVRAQPQPGNGKTSVEIESREWERDAERFLGKI